MAALVIVLVVVVTVGVVIGLAYQATHKTLPTVVSVLDGVQLQIDNYDSFYWTNVKLTWSQGASVMSWHALHLTLSGGGPPRHSTR
jgi:hypothetical protein